MPSNLKPEEIKNLIEVLDAAMQSDTPAVVSALQNLILVAGLAQDGKSGPGPLRQMTDSIDRLESEIKRLRDEVNNLAYQVHRDNTYRSAKNPYPYSTSSTGSTGKSWEYDHSMVNSQDIKDLWLKYAKK